jgi:hypothetical protein
MQQQTNILFPTITPDTIETKVSVSRPQVPNDKVADIGSTWVQKQGKHWPEELTAQTIVANLTLFYLPHWIVNGQGSANWSASVGQDYYVPKQCGRCFGKGIVRASENSVAGSYDKMEHCSLCGGSGKEQVKETRYISQGGFVNGTVAGLAFDNLFPNIVELKLKNRNYSAPQELIDKAQTSDYRILKPEQVSAITGRNLAEKTLADTLKSNAHDIASGMGPVRDLQLVNIQTQFVDAHIWLYPILLGTFNFEDEELHVQLDAITFEIQVEIPQSVKNKRMKDMLIYGGIAAAIVAVVAILFIVLNQ